MKPLSRSVEWVDSVSFPIQPPFTSEGDSRNTPQAPPFPPQLLAFFSSTSCLFLNFLPTFGSTVSEGTFAGVEVKTAVEFAKAVEDFLGNTFPHNQVLVDAVTGQFMLEQDGYSVVFASEGPPLLGCKGHGKNHPKTVKEAQASCHCPAPLVLSTCHPSMLLLHEHFFSSTSSSSVLLSTIFFSQSHIDPSM
jgi:hypothetical protein